MDLNMGCDYGSKDYTITHIWQPVKETFGCMNRIGFIYHSSMCNIYIHFN